MTTDTKPTDAEIDAAWRESVAKHETTAAFVRDFARAVLARWGAQQVPAGYALVPVEPTEDMFIDGMEADCCGRPSIDDDGHVRSIWAAMLTAAPRPVAREPLTLDEFRKAFHEYTGCIVGTNQGLLMAAKSATERAHGIAASGRRDAQ